jgi:penicillin-binding protein 1A
MVRAGLANLGNFKSQGASTITMQVARNVYLSSEKTYTRKIYEVLLTFKLEHLLTKDQILEIYMNQIFLGNRAYGFAAASEAYFDKPLKNITIAEAAMLAGLPKAPGTNNPIRNPKRARARQLLHDRAHGGKRLHHRPAGAGRPDEELKLKTGPGRMRVHAEYVAETVRQLVFAQYGNETYTRGLNVYTTIKPGPGRRLQGLAARHHGFRTAPDLPRPGKFIDLPKTRRSWTTPSTIAVLDAHPDNGDVMSAVVLEADPKLIRAVRQNSETLEITGEGLKPAQSGLS